MSAVASYTSSAIVIIGAEIYVRLECQFCKGKYLTPRNNPESMCLHCQLDPKRRGPDPEPKVLRKKARTVRVRTAYNQAYYLAHREELNAYQKSYREAYPEWVRERNRRYLEAHREELAAKKRQVRARKRAEKAA